MYSQERLERIFFLIFFAFLVLFLLWILLLSKKYYYLSIFLAISAAVLTSKINRISTKLAKISYPKLLLERLSQIIQNLRLYAILMIAIFLRMLWSLYYRVIPYSDFERIFYQAGEFAAGNWSVLGITKTPFTILFYGILFKVFDDSLIVIYVSNSVLAALQVYLVYRISKEVFQLESAAKFCALLAAVFPSLIMFSSVMSSELPFVSILLILILFVIRFLERCESASFKILVGYVLALGIIIVALHLARNIGILIGIWTLLIIALFSRISLRKRLMFILGLIVWTFICLGPQILYNYREYKVFSIQSSPYGTLNLFMGANRSSGGSYTREDWLKITSKYPLEGESANKASQYALQLAKQRIFDDPTGFAVFAVTSKFKKMWCDDSFGGRWSLSRSSRTTLKDTNRFTREPYRIMPRKANWPALSNHAYFAIILFMLISLLISLFSNRVNSPAFVLMAGIIAITFLAHLFLEVQSRYHFHINFLFCILAGRLIYTESSDRQQQSIKRGIPPYK